MNQPHDKAAFLPVLALVILGLETNAITSETPPETTEPLTLQQALELTSRHNPELASSAYGVRIAEKNARQAGTWPNPEIEMEAEEFGGSGPQKGYDSAQTTVRLSQTIDLSGKPGKRRELAKSETKLAEWELEAKRLDIRNETKKAFVDLLMAQEQLSIAESALVLAEDVKKAAADRVAAGKVAPLELTKAEVEASSARISRDKARRDIEISRLMLAACWGNTTPQFQKVTGVWDMIIPPPSLSTLSAAIEQTPEIAQWKDRIRASHQALNLAKAERIPEMTVSAGIRRFEEDGTQAGLAGISLPLPLFNRNTGNILAANDQLTRADFDLKAARLRSTTGLMEALGRLETAQADAIAIKSEVLPVAQQSFESAQTGYREGKFGYLDVLDAQRTLSEARSRYMEVITAYHKAAADVERLTGLPLNTIQ